MSRIVYVIIYCVAGYLPWSPEWRIRCWTRVVVEKRWNCAGKGTEIVDIAVTQQRRSSWLLCSDDSGTCAVAPPPFSCTHRSYLGNQDGVR